MSITYQGSWFGSNFNLFSIKVDHFRSLFDLKIDVNQWKDQKRWLKVQKSWLKAWKSWLKDQKSRLKDWNYQYILKKLIYFDFFNQFQTILI